MEVVPFTHRNGGPKKLAALIPSITADVADVQAVVHLLMGQHERSGDLLLDVLPGSTPATMGATKLMYLFFGAVPESDGRPCSGGVYALQEWVSTVLNPAMPDGWGAAMTQPAMFPLASYDGEPFHAVQILNPTEEDRREAYGIIVSPMERAKTGPATGNTIRDFDAPDGTPTLLPIG